MKNARAPRFVGLPLTVSLTTLVLLAFNSYVLLQYLTKIDPPQDMRQSLTFELPDPFGEVILPRHDGESLDSWFTRRQEIMDKSKALSLKE